VHNACASRTGHAIVWARQGRGCQKVTAGFDRVRALWAWRSGPARRPSRSHTVEGSPRDFSAADAGMRLTQPRVNPNGTVQPGCRPRRHRMLPEICSGSTFPVEGDSCDNRARTERRKCTSSSRRCTREPPPRGRNRQARGSKRPNSFRMPDNPPGMAHPRLARYVSTWGPGPMIVAVFLQASPASGMMCEGKTADAQN
jgi:hypothetical protein